MLLAEHAAPHPPQLATVFRSVSHPSALLFALQSPHPAAHTPTSHEPLEQAGVTWFIEQALPQALQFATLLLRSISHPSICLFPLQSVHPTAHTPALQEPPEQAGATWFVEHAIPQPPQLRTVGTQFPPQRANPESQDTVVWRRFPVLSY